MTTLRRLRALLVLAAALAAGGCGVGGEGRAAGGTASRRVDVTGATRLAVDSGFDVRVSIGQAEAAVVRYDERIADRIDVGVVGGTLRVRLKPNDDIEDWPDPRAEVTLRRLEAVQAARGSTVTVASKVQGPGLRLELSGSSRVAADLGVDRAEGTVSGASRLELTGTAGALEVNGSGASNLALAGLAVDDLDVQLSGASRADVRTDGTIAAQLSGASSLTYRGTPDFTRRDTSGASTIQPA
jgi:Putative auto-transporter adhesin, head GIN domain